MSQEAPTSCIHVPTFETTVAIQSQRKIGRRSGVHNPTGAGSVDGNEADSGLEVVILVRAPASWAP